MGDPYGLGTLSCRWLTHRASGPKGGHGQPGFPAVTGPALSRVHACGSDELLSALRTDSHPSRSRGRRSPDGEGREAAVSDGASGDDGAAVAHDRRARPRPRPPERSPSLEALEPGRIDAGDRTGAWPSPEAEGSGPPIPREIHLARPDVAWPCPQGEGSAGASFDQGSDSSPLGDRIKIPEVLEDVDRSDPRQFGPVGIRDSGCYTLVESPGIAQAEGRIPIRREEWRGDGMEVSHLCDARVVLASRADRLRYARSS